MRHASEARSGRVGHQQLAILEPRSPVLDHRRVRLGDGAVLLGSLDARVAHHEHLVKLLQRFANESELYVVNVRAPTDSVVLHEPFRPPGVFQVLVFSSLFELQQVGYRERLVLRDVEKMGNLQEGRIRRLRRRAGTKGR
eukprot:337405_1